VIADAKLRYGKVKFQVCNAENLKFNGKIVLEFGGKNNVKTIVDQLRSSLKKRGYLNQSKLELWYFPSAEEYSKELELVGFKVVLAESFNRKTELTNQKDGIKDWISMFAKSFFKDVDLTHIEEIKTEVQESIKEKCFTNGKWYADYKRIRFIAIKNIY
jgi:hypothetical protein